MYAAESTRARDMMLVKWRVWFVRRDINTIAFDVVCSLVICPPMGDTRISARRWLQIPSVIYFCENVLTNEFALLPKTRSRLNCDSSPCQLDLACGLR